MSGVEPGFWKVAELGGGGGGGATPTHFLA